MMDRVLPNHFELEQSFLAGCIVFPDMLSDAADMITGRHFYAQRHKTIFATLLDLMERGEPTDARMLAARLSESEKLADVGGPAYIAKLLDEVPPPTNLEHYANKIRWAAVLRDLIVACEEIKQGAFQAKGDAEEIIGQAQERILALDDDGASSDFAMMEGLTQKSLDRYQAASKGEGPEGLPTGFKTLDRLIGGGIHGGLLVIIAARPAIGKTAFMISMARNMAISGITCGVFSLEMSAAELDDRWMAIESGVNSVRLMQGADENEWRRIYPAAERKARWPIIIDDCGNLTAQEIKRRARRMRKAGAQIIFIDQLSKVRSDAKKPAWEANTENVVELGALKKELKIPIVLLAQINRRAEETASKRPTLAHLKMTGALEEEADIVLLGHRNYPYTRKEEDRHHAEWVIAKNRQGPISGAIPMHWEARFTLFSEK